ncbi:hypothetical protein [Labrys monachus]|uniref:Uncharacterized protein n=1 Tax=Labrys monachus TaxID=217067 RepID=A0ABU0FEN6_9HYPH|nr:hypothetical protein [Labrys monachus]MDQ0393067.1 hypothetical protein [Labrys monachus]
MFALVPLLFAGAASAQSVNNMKGNVLVNHGNGFVLMAADGPVAVGDTVMARPHGRATLTYVDGCKVDIIPGTVTTVESVSPCAFGQAANPDSTGQASGLEAGSSGLPADALIAAGLGVGITGGFIATDLTSQENPASP